MSQPASSSSGRPQRSADSRRLPDKYLDTPSAGPSPAGPSSANTSPANPSASPSADKMKRKTITQERQPKQKALQTRDETALKKLSTLLEQQKSLKAAMNRKDSAQDGANNTPPVKAKYGPRILEIYPWEYPYPKPDSWSKLSKMWREWKEKTDAKEAANDIDDGMDDWDSLLPFTPSALTNIGTELDFVIAVTFVKRAKRAFWAGQTWKAFATHETQLVSADNDLRLEVLGALAGRLCNEIWLEDYPGPEPVASTGDQVMADAPSGDLADDLANGLDFGSGDEDTDVPRATTEM